MGYAVISDKCYYMSMHKRLITVNMDVVLHRFLRIPYVLNVRHFRRVKNARATLLFIHGLGDTGDLWREAISKLPDDVNHVAVDLLGFGESPKPVWNSYDATNQARCLLATYIKLRINTPVIIVGHSLGCLVGVEFAKRYRLLSKELVLCSPPIYNDASDDKFSLRQDDVLRKLYKWAAKSPSLVIDAYNVAKKLRLAHPSIAVNDGNIDMFIKTLHASIINQRVLLDIAQIKKPIVTINGLLDPLVVRSNLVKLRKANENIRVIDIPTSHSVTKLYNGTIVKVILECLENRK